MPQYAVDTLIKSIRIERGLTQVQLAEGICTRETVSRIERGEHLPDWYTFSMILKRLGQDPVKYYNSIATKDDMRVDALNEEMSGYLRRGERDSMKVRIQELEEDPLFTKGVYRSKMLEFKAAYLSNVNELDTALDTLMEAFRITRPDFEADKIDAYILTYSEMTKVNTLAIIYKKMYGLGKGTEILKKLRTNMEKGYIDDNTRRILYVTVIYNIALNSSYAEQWDECMEACETGLPLAVYYNDISLYAKFMPMKSYCLLKMDKKEEGLALCKKTFCLFIGLDMDVQYKAFQKDLEDEFGIRIDI